MPSGYREYRHYSPSLDSEACRLSMTDNEGREYFTIVPASEGKRWREAKEQALTMIEDAIVAGYPPGEVRGAGFPGARGGVSTHKASWVAIPAAPAQRAPYTGNDATRRTTLSTGG